MKLFKLKKGKKTGKEIDKDSSKALNKELNKKTHDSVDSHIQSEIDKIEEILSDGFNERVPLDRPTIFVGLQAFDFTIIRKMFTKDRTPLDISYYRKFYNSLTTFYSMFSDNPRLFADNFVSVLQHQGYHQPLFFLPQDLKESELYLIQNLSVYSTLELHTFAVVLGIPNHYSNSIIDDYHRFLKSLNLDPSEFRPHIGTAVRNHLSLINYLPIEVRGPQYQGYPVLPTDNLPSSYTPSDNLKRYFSFLELKLLLPGYSLTSISSHQGNFSEYLRTQSKSKVSWDSVSSDTYLKSLDDDLNQLTKDSSLESDLHQPKSSQLESSKSESLQVETSQIESSQLESSKLESPQMESPQSKLDKALSSMLKQCGYAPEDRKVYIGTNLQGHVSYTSVTIPFASMVLCASSDELKYNRVPSDILVDILLNVLDKCRISTKDLPQA